MKKTVLFVCLFNSIRSQIAEGLLNARCGDRYQAYSAGIAPGGLSPHAVAVMREAGIDISHQKSKKLSSLSVTRFDYVITLCDHAKRACDTSLPECGIRIHNNFESPSEIPGKRDEVLEEFRALRNEIDAWLEEIFPDCPRHKERRTAVNDGEKRKESDPPGV